MIEIQTNLCECGCGQPVTLSGNRFLRYHHSKSIQWKEETLQRRSISLKRHYKYQSSWKKGLVCVDGKWIKKSEVIFPFCLCGCGRRVSKLTNKYAHGHNGIGEHYNVGKTAWNKGLTKETSPSMKKIADKLSGPAPISIPCRCGCGMTTRPGSQYISGHNFVGKKQSEETIAKRQAKVIGQKRPNGNWNPWSTGLTKKSSLIIKKMAKKTSKSMKANFQDKDFCKHWGQTHRVSPNKLELHVGSMLDRLFPGEYKFIGNFKQFLGGKCPDFINCNGQKKLIEVFGNFWHRNSNPEKRISHFAQYGFKTLVLWEDQIKRTPALAERSLVSFHTGVRPNLTM